MPSGENSGGRWLWITVAFIAAVLLAYSQTLSLTWDEGFHLLAAHMILAGKRPYVDFIFAQTPLNAYWVAVWMRVIGESWHTAHALAALESAGAVALVADYLYRRYPNATWRVEAAIAGAVFTGLNVVVVEYGTLGQAYGICLLLTVAAFRFAVLAPGRRSMVWATLAGFAAGAAAASSLLTVTVAPVVLIWILWRNAAGSRWRKALAFAAGTVVAFLPMLWLFLAAPGQVIFDVVKFHLYYRQTQWEGWQIHDLEIFTAWLDSSQALILGAFAIAGTLLLRRRAWPDDERAELWLCCWLAGSMSLYLMTAHPTFARYFLLPVPFLAILAASGLEGLVTRMNLGGARWPVALVALFTAAALGRSLYEDHVDSWYRIEPIAKKVAEVTPGGEMLYAEEPIYFLLHWTPPPGMEWNGSHKVDLPLAQAAPLHILPRAELIRQIKAGVFATAETCGEGEPEALSLAEVYRQKAEINDCFVFWDRRRPPESGAQ